MKPTYEDLEHQVAEQREIIRKLQQMNQNTAEQSVAGYKAGLASALKSIVEDAQLPEAKTDPEIARALLEDMLDVLRYKGVIQKEKR